ncbi:MAG TPA: hypothetical protein VK171_16630 [Fimbriimonas sp.]|nr:hypothetical protein [Fimbriimonas sp.]
MNLNRFWLATVFTLWIAGGFQQGLAFRLSVFGVEPDYLLIGAALLGFMGGINAAIVAGFAAGLIHAALAGTDTWQFIGSKMIACLFCAFVIESRFQRNIGVAAVAVAVATIIASLILMIVAPSHLMGSPIKATIIGAIYNGVIAFAVYFPLESLTGTKGKEI